MRSSEGENRELNLRVVLGADEPMSGLKKGSAEYRREQNKHY